MARDPFHSEELVEFTGDNIGEFLLNVLTKGLYNRPDLIIREYIQNSHDAICRWSNQMTGGRIDIKVAWPNIHIFDNGPGMHRNELLRAMSNIGKSFKDISASSGFMGIGKLAGLSMASRVEIHSSKYGCDEKNWVVFNSDEMLASIMKRRLQGEQRSILETLNQHTRSNKQPLSEVPDKHYTAVHLIDIHDEYRDKIENIEEFKRSIGLIAPVIQHPDFEYAEKIDNKLSLMIPRHYQPVDIYINGRPVYRPYIEGLAEPQEIYVADDDGNILAYGWASLYTASERNKRQIPDEDLRGIQLLQRGIAIGSRSLPEEMGLYSSTSTNIHFRWYCGELYIVDPNIILSADRTRIRQSSHTVDFIARVAKEFKKLSKKAGNFSKRDNARVMMERSVTKVEEIENEVKTKPVNRDRVPRIVSELGKAQTEIEKRRNDVEDAELKQEVDETENKIEEILNLLINPEDSEDKVSSENDETLPLSELMEVPLDDTKSSQQEEEISEDTIVVDITEQLKFSPREARIYGTIVQAIASACGGRDSKKFHDVILAIEDALIETFGEADIDEGK